MSWLKEGRRLSDQIACFQFLVGNVKVPNFTQLTPVSPSCRVVVDLPETKATFQADFLQDVGADEGSREAGAFQVGGHVSTQGPGSIVSSWGRSRRVHYFKLLVS